MEIRNLSDNVSVSGDVALTDLEELKRLGVKTLVCNLPEDDFGEGVTLEKLRAATSLLRIYLIHLPFVNDQVGLNDVDQLSTLMQADQRVHLFSESGKRSAMLWALAAIKLGYQEESIVQQVNDAGCKLTVEKLHGLVEQTLLADANQKPLDALRRQRMEYYDVVIVGGGSAGVSVCASILKRKRGLRVAVVEPNHRLYYQPGWTMVGGGVFTASATKKHTKNFIPAGVTWIQVKAESFSPERNLVRLQNGNQIHYQQLVIAAGLELNWDGIEGLRETLGRNGVTSNYRYDLAPYTWQLVQDLKGGNALFTQPPMPIKCAGAPQKAMYLSSDYWLKNNVLKNIHVEFYSAGEVIFGVPDYVPALNEYLDKYDVGLHFKHTLTKIDGETKTAYFTTTDADGEQKTVKSPFDMIHVCPPQRAPRFIRESQLCDEEGWLNVDQATLVHVDYENIWGIGDVINAPNAKTLAAVRKQVPVVAQNLVNALRGQAATVAYSGYGSCPLTVERGKIVLAEFVYGGEHSPTFPQWMNDGTKPTRFGWIVKSKVLPYVYWHQMLKGIEWLVEPEKLEP